MTPLSTAPRHPKQCWVDLRNRELHGDKLPRLQSEWWREALGYRRDTPIEEVQADLEHRYGSAR